jgi:lysophospholipase L1-like esterase
MRPSREWVNQLGFLGDEIEIPKPSGVCRVLFLGDSVAAQEYDRRIERQLKSRASRPVDGVSLSMPGYSSHQGRIVVGRYADLVEPDVAVLSYGWNDHWLAFGAPDADKVVEQRDSALLRAIDVAFRAARVLQGTAILAERLSPEPQQHVTWGRKVRVPIDDYRRNLEWIGDFFVARGAPVILLTPPTSFYDRGVPDYYVEHGFAADAASAIALHRAYNQEVRELAVQRGWPLLDLERELEGSPELKWIFLDDGVHLTERGADELVRRIAEALRRDPPSAACLSGGS